MPDKPQLIDPERRPPAHEGPVDWRRTPLVLSVPAVTLRTLDRGDAAALLVMIGSAEVCRYISPPPASVAGFRRFIEWTSAERAAGRSITFGLVPAGMEEVVGVFQLRALGPGFELAEWGVALGSPFWGSGLYVESARLAIDFAFTVLGAHRLEARSAVENHRGNAAMRKIGAVQEAVLRMSLLRDGRYLSQVLWTILEHEWMRDREPSQPAVN